MVLYERHGTIRLAVRALRAETGTMLSVATAAVWLADAGVALPPRGRRRGKRSPAVVAAVQSALAEARRTGEPVPSAASIAAGAVHRTTISRALRQAEEEWLDEQLAEDLPSARPRARVKTHKETDGT